MCDQRLHRWLYLAIHHFLQLVDRQVTGVNGFSGSFNCTCSDSSSATNSCNAKKGSDLTKICVAGTGSDTVSYICVGD